MAGTRIGCLGGGQLGRMLALAGYPMGLSFTFLEPAPGSCAGQVAGQIQGAYDDPSSLALLQERSDLVTFEFESVPDTAARHLARRLPIFPPPGALAAGQDRLQEKRLFAELGIPSASFTELESAAELGTAATRVGLPALLKSRRLGYDGRGQRPVAAAGELASAWSELDRVPAILERRVPFEREVSVLGVRSASGQLATYPLTENHHHQGILRLSLAPAPGLAPSLQSRADAIVTSIMERLEYVGVLAVELFQVGPELVANEIAPRVHNSGHWTLDGAECSQFENHLRAGLGWSLGSTRTSSYSAMLNLVGELPSPAQVAAIPGAHLHLYGKQPRPGRKLGHVNFAGPDPRQVTRGLLELAASLGAALPQPGYPASYWPL